MYICVCVCTRVCVLVCLMTPTYESLKSWNLVYGILYEALSSIRYIPLSIIFGMKFPIFKNAKRKNHQFLIARIFILHQSPWKKKQVFFERFATDNSKYFEYEIIIPYISYIFLVSYKIAAHIYRSQKPYIMPAHSNVVSHLFSTLEMPHKITIFFVDFY